MIANVITALVNATTGTSTAVNFNTSSATIGNDLIIIVGGHDNGANSWSVTFPKGGVATAFTTLWSDSTTGFSVKYLIAPDRITGTGSLIFTRASGPMAARAVLFRDVDQTTPIDSYVSDAYPGSNNVSESLVASTTQNGAMSVLFSYAAGSIAQSAGNSDTTLIATTSNAFGSVAVFRGASLNKPIQSKTLIAQTASAVARVGVLLNLNSSAPGQYTEKNVQTISAADYNKLGVVGGSTTITPSGTFASGPPYSNTLTISCPAVSNIRTIEIQATVSASTSGSAYVSFELINPLGQAHMSRSAVSTSVTTTPILVTYSDLNTGGTNYSFAAGDWVLNFRDTGTGSPHVFDNITINFVQFLPSQPGITLRKS